MKCQTALCPYCGKKFVYSEVYKWKPCCSEECFKKRIGIFEKKRISSRHSFVHESFCKTCGKKVDVLLCGGFCSENCEEIFEKIAEKKYNIKIFCVLCGRKFVAKTAKSRFCDGCRKSSYVNCSCFRSSERRRFCSDSGLGEMLILSRKKGKSYAELQKEEALRKLKGR